MDVHERDAKTDKRDFGKMSTEEMRGELDIDWEAELEGLDTEGTGQKFKDIVTAAMDKHIPWKSMKGRKKETAVVDWRDQTANSKKETAVG